MENCQECSKMLTKKTISDKEYLFCETKSCRNIWLSNSDANNSLSYYLHNTSSIFKFHAFLQINLNLMLHVPKMFINSIKPISTHIQNTLSDYHKNLKTAETCKKHVGMYRKHMLFPKGKEEYFFQKYYNAMIENLGIGNDYEVSCMSKYCCTNCDIVYHKPVSGKSIPISLLLLRSISVSKSQIVYYVKCGKCSKQACTEISIRNKPKYLTVFLKNGYCEDAKSSENLSHETLEPIVILEVDGSSVTKNFTLWTRLSHLKNLWYCQTNNNERVVKLVEKPTIKPENVRLFIYDTSSEVSQWKPNLYSQIDTRPKTGRQLNRKRISPTDDVDFEGPCTKKRRH